MASATAEKKTAKPRQERVRFAAPLAAQGNPLKITVQRMREIFDAETGRKQSDPTTGVYINFVDEGTGVQAYETTDPHEIELLRIRSSQFGTFHEVPIPKPSSAPVLSQVLDLTLAGDKAGLLALAEAEQDGFQREDVLEALGKALDRLP